MLVKFVGKCRNYIFSFVLCFPFFLPFSLLPPPLLILMLSCLSCLHVIVVDIFIIIAFSCPPLFPSPSLSLSLSPSLSLSLPTTPPFQLRSPSLSSRYRATILLHTTVAIPQSFSHHHCAASPPCAPIEVTPSPSPLSLPLLSPSLIPFFFFSGFSF